jgi:hypothetical protein
MAGLTLTTPVTSTIISPVKILIGRKSLTNLHSENFGALLFEFGISSV